MRIKPLIGLVVALWVATVPAAAQTLLPIGTIQGAADVSPYLNRFVNFRGVVVGRYEDENTRGDVYYTLFIQGLPEATDGDPATSEGIAVFLGREPRSDILLGTQVWVGGKVTEFYGLTEIDDKGLVLTIEEPAGPIPEPVLIDPPADMDELAVYFEALEGMRVAYPGAVVVAGPTHEGCGFAVIGEADESDLPIIRRSDDDPAGRAVPVLYPSDLNCDDIPQVKTGDRMTGMAGVLTYNFDQFKIVIDSADPLSLAHAPMPAILPLPTLGPKQISLVSINAEDYFDTVRDTEEEGEPVLTDEELSTRRDKLAYIIAQILDCPTLIAFQEVEHEALLGDLSAMLAEPCHFIYQVSHVESPDARGIDNGLMSDPRHVKISGVELRQSCSPVPTEVTDSSVNCPTGEDPLFGRPPLQADALIDGKSYTIFINHFKSKRGGEIETGLERVRQAVYLNGLAAEMLTADPAARLIVLGDLNDTEMSPTLALLTDPAQGGLFNNALAVIPENQRYSFNFGGVSEMIDAILLSPALIDEMSWATIVHSNTDFPAGWRLDTSPERLPFRVTDHDMPVVILGQFPPAPTPTPTPIPEPTAVDRSAVATPIAGIQSPTSLATSNPQPPAAASAVATSGVIATNSMAVSAQTQSSQTRAIVPALLGASLVLLIGLFIFRVRR